jgi:HEAT repeat protein
MHMRVLAILSLIVLAAVGGGVVYYLKGRSAIDQSRDSAAVASLELKPAEETASAPSSALALLDDPANKPDALVRLVDKESGDRFDSAVAYDLPAVEADEEIAAVVAVLLDHTDADTARHQAAELLRRSQWPGLSQALMQVLRNPEEQPRFRSWATQHLYNVHEVSDAVVQAEIAAALDGLVEDRDPEVRREALLSLSRIGSPAVVDAAVAWLGDSDDATEVSDLAIRILRENDARNHIDIVRGFADSSHQPSRIAALVTLSQWNDHASRPAMERAANLPDTNANFRLRRCGQMALARLSPEADSTTP